MEGKILIANRGEIAVRAIRTVKELGLEAVSVYSDPDHASPHVDMADEAHRLGPGPVAESYLLKERLLELAIEAVCFEHSPTLGVRFDALERTELAREEVSVEEIKERKPLQIKNFGIWLR